VLAGTAAYGVYSTVETAWPTYENTRDLATGTTSDGHGGTRPITDIEQAEKTADAITGALSLSLLAGFGAKAMFSSSRSPPSKYTGQGFTRAQADKLAEQYDSAGHHFPIKQATVKEWVARGIPFPKWLRDNPLNVLKPDVSRGDFYELHYRVDPTFNSANFSRSIGGTWTASRIPGMPDKYGRVGQYWYGTSDAFKLTFGSGVVTAGTPRYPSPPNQSSDDKR
jgi:hypothetical protein